LTALDPSLGLGMLSSQAHVQARFLTAQAGLLTCFLTAQAGLLTRFLTLHIPN